MTDTPEARRRLIGIAEVLEQSDQVPLANSITEVVRDYLHRRAPVRITGPRSRRMSPEVAQEIRELANETDLASVEIATQVGVNPGRVSEVLQGDR